MRFWTWSEIRTKVENECDLQDETFVRSDELLEYVNEAIDEAEAEIHSLYEDYFLTSSDIPVVAADQLLALPTDIYAHKIRRIIFSTGGNGQVYTVDRLQDWKKFEVKAVADAYNTTDLYQWFMVNSTPGEPKIQVVPALREAGTMKVWYLRNANRLYTDTDICDIPEFINFIFSHMKVKVYEKEGNPMLEEALQKLAMERERMSGTLAQMVPDAQNEVEMDTRLYDEMS